MKKLLLVLMMLIPLSACQYNTEYGECIGLDDDQNPALVYDLSTRNIVLGVVFSQMLVPPIYVALEATHCPVRKR